MKQKKKRSRAEIDEIVSTWRQSGLTRQSFCEQEQLSMATFASWIKKEREQSHVTPLSVVPLRIDGYAPDASCGFEVEYPNGVRLRLTAIPSIEELSRIIHIYQGHVFAE